MNEKETAYLGESFMSNYLAHYSSQYYDPQKAREYYLRTRELKGRRSTKGLSKEGKFAWKVAKEQITNEKKGTLKGTSEKQKAELAGVRTRTQMKRKVLSKKISDVLKVISEDTKKKIEAVPKVPKGLSKQARAKAALKRREEIAKIRGEADSEKKGTRESGLAARKKVASDLKEVVTKAKDKYTQLREEIKVEYEEKYQTEFDAIKSNF